MILALAGKKGTRMKHYRVKGGFYGMLVVCAASEDEARAAATEFLGSMLEYPEDMTVTELEQAPGVVAYYLE